MSIVKLASSSPANSSRHSAYGVVMSVASGGMASPRGLRRLGPLRGVLPPFTTAR
jgi:hypothetical protein